MTSTITSRIKDYSKGSEDLVFCNNKNKPEQPLMLGWALLKSNVECFGRGYQFLRQHFKQ